MTSQINPNNIDGNYPVPGVPNNSQGMRDNFTNIKTNFQYAADEINQIQNNAVFKAAVTGTTLDNNMNDNLLYAVKLQDVSWTSVQQAATTGSITLDYSAAQFQVIGNTTGSVSLGFSNWPSSGSQGVLTLSISISNVAHTLTLPATVSVGIAYIQGVSPGTPGVSNTITFAQTGTYIYEFTTSDGGATITIEEKIRPSNIYENIVNISNTTPSTSTVTGALTVAGGMGVVGNVYAGRFYGDGQYLSNIYPNYVFNGTSYMGFGASNGNANISVDGTSNVVVVSTTGATVSGNVTVTGTGGVSLTDSGTVGYGTGAGGTVAQSGNKSGGVTLNKPAGEITMQNTSLSAASIVSFVLTNSCIANHDLLVINHVSGGTLGAYTFTASCNTGSATIYVRNATGGSLSEAIVLRFAVIKGTIT